MLTLSKIYPAFLLLSMAIIFPYNLTAQDPPFTVKADLFDENDPDSLGLEVADGTETFTVFAPVDTTDKFSNGVVMTVFKGWLYCMWQSSAQDEDAADTWVAYSRSLDGIEWTEPMVLAPSLENGYCSSGGWWSTSDTLVAYINTWPSEVTPRGGYTRYATSTDGMNWSEIKALTLTGGDTLKGIFEQDPHALPDGRIINAAHFQPGLVINPIYTDDPTGIRNWVKADFTSLTPNEDISREIEPSWFRKEDGTVVMTFRDQDGTFKRLAATSSDRGESWSSAVLTDMPDSRSKQSAGNLGDTTAFMVGNPVNYKTRIPLAITLSKDGDFFNTAYLLRAGGAGIQELRYDGTAKRLGYHYPKSMQYNNFLYVSYAVNKEDVQYTRVPLQSLVPEKVENPDTTSVRLVELKARVFVDQARNIRIQSTGLDPNGKVNVYNITGRRLISLDIITPDISIDMGNYPTASYIVEIRNAQGHSAKLVYLW